MTRVTLPPALHPRPPASGPLPLSPFLVLGPTPEALGRKSLGPEFPVALGTQGVKIKAANGRPSQRLAAEGP